MKNKDIEYISQERMEYCKNCPHNDNGVCNICGCILELKTRSLQSYCPLSDIGEKSKWASVDE